MGNYNTELKECAEYLKGLCNHENIADCSELEVV
jgi:hypothetical protein